MGIQGMSNIRFSFAAFALLLLLGCGGGGVELGQVSGQVTLDGKPVTDLIIVFHPTARADGINAATRQAMGETDAEGHYVLGTHSPGDGAAVGQHRVKILPAQREGGVPGILPSGYVAEVQSGSNTIDLELQPFGKN